ncbi:retinol dehydrogenase 12-like [Drosophila bipectinata]|uniref:retinol dehydrogenase 12-like n=1 Tax=Drosophila bipectinata TaxID=42026 RepID=UPI001C892468|nr:retinol dehydrogenase 12-like [Drosophila bipectinata]
MPFCDGEFTKKTDETGKVFIVTGGNAGIGKETVLEIAKRGGTVIMACRNIEKANQAREEIVSATNNPNVCVRKLDLGSMDSIRQFAEGFKKEKDNLHVLINNAGVMGLPRTLTKDGFEMQMGINHMGHFLLTHLLLDVLKKTAPSRIVNVSSVSHERGTIKMDDLNSEKSYSRFGAYEQSKLANVLFTRELAKRLEGTGVTVNALHPGAVDTDIVDSLPSAMKFIAKPAMWMFFKTPKSGAQTSLYAALDPELEKVTGKYFCDCKPKEVSSAAKDEKTAKFLWTESQKWTGVKE